MTTPSSAQEIGFIERFALAEDRQEVLKELIPGTEDYYFFHALHYQNIQDRESYEATLTQWKQRFERSSQRKILENRQALIEYETDPQATLAYLTEALGVRFDHQRERQQTDPDLATQLDPALIALEAIVERSLRNSQDLGEVSASGIDWLMRHWNEVQLTTAQKRELLGRLERPDYPEIIPALAEDLARPESRGFGEFAVHRQLLRPQLDALAEARPSLLGDAAFVLTKLRKLRPGADVDMGRDPEEKRRYLERAWNFVSALGPAFHSLQANILYAVLRHDQERGVYDKEKFITYLQLPRPVPYLNPEYREKLALWRHPVDLGFDSSEMTGLPPIRDDYGLVRDYLLHFLTGAAAYEEFAPYVKEDYLKALQAEANIVAGLGDPEQWSSQLTPAAYQALKERVDIDFDPTCQERFAQGEAVKLEVHVKNVTNLMVKIYAINTANYYQNFERPVNTDLNLDGLIPNEELSFTYEADVFRRIKRNFVFPQLDKSRGVWVLEFIGNGKSSRALIMRGALHYLVRPSSAGHALRILDSEHQEIPQGYVWMQGKRFNPNDRGEIVIPFSTDPGSRKIVLHDGDDFATLDNLTLQGEHYALDAGFHIAREELIGGREATLAVRPKFSLNGAPADLELLEDVVLTITSKDLDGVESTSRVPDFKLYRHKESTHQLRVPERLAELVFELTATVENLSQGEKEQLSAGDRLSVNEFAKTGAVADLFLRKDEDGYHVQLLGRSGEAMANHAINFNLRRDDFRTDVHTVLRTDEAGDVQLGELPGIYRVTAQAPNGRQYRWVLPEDRRLYPSTIHARTGEVISVPIVDGKVARDAYSLLERSHGTYVSDAGEAISLENGFVRLQGLPAGNYDLFLPEAEKQVMIRVSAGEEKHGFLLGTARNLEKRNPKSLHLEPLRVEGDELVIELINVNALTRVHVLASHYVPAFDAMEALGRGPGLEPLHGRPAWYRNRYVSGRVIGDEYRYILERRYAPKYPGNMLERPGLILNPWELRETSTEEEELRRGGEWQTRGRAQEAASMAPPADAQSQLREDPGQNDPHVLEFLEHSGVSAFNVAPGETGEIRVKLADLKDCGYVRVVAVDPVTVVERHLALPTGEVETLDLRLDEGLNPKRHFRQGNEVTVLEPNKPFVIDDAATASFEVYETLASVYQLWQTLSEGNAHLAEFAFILEWPGLDAAKKRDYYSKHASHELSFFLQRKDPAFFEEVILPYLANKKDKTFMDHYLLGEDLESYLDPWSFARLNVVERALLGERLPGRRQSIIRDIEDWLGTLPPEEQHELVNFDTALGGKALSWYFAADDFTVDKLGAIKEELRGRAAKSTLTRRMDEKKAEAGADKEASLEEESLAAQDGARRNLGLAQLAEQAPAPAQAGAVMYDAFSTGEQLLEEDRLERKLVRGFYRKLDPTKEWAENNYYHLPIAEQNGDLVKVNKFWNDFAKRDPEKPFLSPHIAEASGNFTEMLLALAVLDLPFEVESADDEAVLGEGALTLKPSTPVILFHKEIREAAASGQTKLLVSQNFFRQGEGDLEKTDGAATEEFLAGAVYGCRIVVTNPTSSSQRLDLLRQVPVGSIPVSGSKPTQQVTLRLEPYQTHTEEYYFYFPKAGEFEQFPVHVSDGQKVVAFAEPFTFHVVDSLSKTDTSSWAYVSQWGTEEEVLAYLKEHNLRETDLVKVAWRCRESSAFFDRVIEILQDRYHYNPVIYSYALHHHVKEPLRQYLLHSDGFLQQCGDFLDTKLVVIDPVERRNYQHLEYRPLVNARTYPVGGKHKILNDRFREQYLHLMRIFSYRSSLDDAERMTLTVYLLTQDRIAEALEAFDRVDPSALATRLQYDYLQAYLAFYGEDPVTARDIAGRYAEHPVDRWRERFLQVIAQIDEIEGESPRLTAEEDREQQQDELASSEPSFSFKVENQQIDLLYRNLDSIVVNYYRMDLEFLFSSNPFMASESERFSMIKPNREDRYTLDAGQETLAIPLPSEFEGENVLVEVVGDGMRKATAYYSNQLHVRLATGYGQLQVTQTAGDQRPLPKVYIKVYADINGQPRFYKDGYTDLRGKFDYASLNTGEIDEASRFSILVMSEEHGALVQEAVPPQR